MYFEPGEVEQGTAPVEKTLINSMYLYEYKNNQTDSMNNLR